MIMIASLISITAEPLAQIVSLDDYVLFEEYVNKFLNVADNYSEKISNLLASFNSEDIDQLESSFIH